MRVSLELKDLAKYPFLKESQQFIGASTDTLEQFLSGASGRIAVRHAMERIRISLRMGDRDGSSERIPSDSIDVKLSISGYVLARIIISCATDRALMERLVRYEAERAYTYLLDEDDEKRRYVAASVGLEMGTASLPVVQYVETVAGLHEERWRLINRDVAQGRVTVSPQEMNELLKEQIRVILLRQLPLRVPDKVCSMLELQVGEIRTAYQKTILEQFGAVEEDLFPPCIQALATALTAGTNLPHSGRFALTAFLHNIGMGPAQIIELYCRAPDFDISKTQYQVEHISGRSGTEYTAPSCAAMRTYGLCIKSDGICTKVNHPLNYYRLKKRKEGKKEPTSPSD
ncbi:MAG: DNA primase regulatory subunit PriL [Methanoregulaceae archaeon]|jgi:DNA primase large subunit|nr:DNA primase regulatory subunit PriL [Methanoregulaceae archaeon]